MSDVLNFWFEELSPKQWFEKSDELDKLILDRFLDTHKKAIACELSSYRDTAKGRLAEIIVLDQFSRNIFRDKPEAFMYDSLALALSQEAISIGADKELSTIEKAFLYMPFMHSESLEIHTKALELFDQKGLEDNLKFEQAHYDIIKRFGRYPHRNQILNRASTTEEIEFLKQPGSSF
jgi:uncharacterized protein (DUF924 family)